MLFMFYKIYVQIYHSLCQSYVSRQIKYETFFQGAVSQTYAQRSAGSRQCGVYLVNVFFSSVVFRFVEYPLPKAARIAGCRLVSGIIILVYKP